MVRFFPNSTDCEFDLADAVRKSERQKDFMRPEQRGTGTELRELGDIWLPLDLTGP
jgi:hypothetical protein